MDRSHEGSVWGQPSAVPGFHHRANFPFAAPLARRADVCADGNDGNTALDARCPEGGGGGRGGRGGHPPPPPSIAGAALRSHPSTRASPSPETALGAEVEASPGGGAGRGGGAAGGGAAGLGRESASPPARPPASGLTPPLPPGKEAGRPRPLVVRPSTPRGPGGWPAAPRRTASTCCSRASGRSRAARRTRPRSSSGAWPPPRPLGGRTRTRSRTSGPGRCSRCRSPASAASCPASTPRRAAGPSRQRWCTWACTGAPPSSGSRCVRRHGSRAGP